MTESSERKLNERRDQRLRLEGAIEALAEVGNHYRAKLAELEKEDKCLTK